MRRTFFTTVLAVAGVLAVLATPAAAQDGVPDFAAPFASSYEVRDIGAPPTVVVKKGKSYTARKRR